MLISTLRFNHQWVKTADNSYKNDAYYVDPGEQTIEMKSTTRSYSLSNAPDTKPEEHFYEATDDCQQAKYGPWVSGSLSGVDQWWKSYIHQLNQSTEDLVRSMYIEDDN